MMLCLRVEGAVAEMPRYNAADDMADFRALDEIERLQSSLRTPQARREFRKQYSDNLNGSSVTAVQQDLQLDQHKHLHQLETVIPQWIPKSIHLRIYNP